jgi:hypothetical protein
MDARWLRLVATVILYGSLVLAFCVPVTHPEVPLRLWSMTWACLWVLFMGLLVVCDRSLFHYSFRMIYCTVAARLGCSVVIAAVFATRYHHLHLPYLHEYVRGITHRALVLPAFAPVAAAVVVVSFFAFLRLRRREQFFTGQK